MSDKTIYPAFLTTHSNLFVVRLAPFPRLRGLRCRPYPPLISSLFLVFPSALCNNRSRLVISFRMITRSLPDCPCRPLLLDCKCPTELLNLKESHQTQLRDSRWTIITVIQSSATYVAHWQTIVFHLVSRIKLPLWLNYYPVCPSTGAST